MNDYCNYTNNIINRFCLGDFVTLEQYLTEPKAVRNKLPNIEGVYFVIYPYQSYNEMFVNPGTGGYFKGNNPNVEIEELQNNWIEGADILYIGKAGGVSVNGKVSNATLNDRILALLKFGNGKNIGHWGGRYLWQHEASKKFKIYWYGCENENPVQLERNLQNDFKHKYGRLPFANLI